MSLRSPFFFFNDTATTEIYTLSLHDALPISQLFEQSLANQRIRPGMILTGLVIDVTTDVVIVNVGLKSEAVIPLERSEEHTSELQSQSNLVCRLLLEKKTSR